MNKTLVTTLLVLTMLFWAVNFHVVKIAMEYYSPIPVAAFRFFFAAVVLIAVAYFDRQKKGLRNQYSGSEKWYIFLTAFFGIFLTIFFFNKGLETGTAVNGSLIISTSPLMVAILAYFTMKRKISPIQILAILISFFGVAMILVKGDLSQLLQFQFEKGDLLILCMALVFSISQIIVAKYIPHIDSIQLTANATLIAFLLFLLCSIPELISQPMPVAFRFWASILFMGILGTSIAYTIFYMSIVRLGASKTTLFMNLIPLFAVITAIPFGEKVFAAQLIGGVIVIAGLLLFGLKKPSIQTETNK